MIAKLTTSVINILFSVKIFLKNINKSQVFKHRKIKKTILWTLTQKTNGKILKVGKNIKKGFNMKSLKSFSPRKGTLI
jgi:hypothetical protein